MGSRFIRLVGEMIPHYSFALRQRLLGARWRRPVSAVAGQGNLRSALLVYLAAPFHVRDLSSPMYRFHQNAIQARQIAEALGAAGFSVDIADISDHSFRPNRTYDLVVSHRVDAAGLERAFRDDTLKVYLSSGMNHRAYNRNVKARFEYLKKRRGFSPSKVRLNSEQMPFVSEADVLVGFGNAAVLDTWKEDFKGPCFGFDNYAFDWLRAPRRSWSQAARHFLYLGSRASVEKGLDLALEAFSGLDDVHLHVCGGHLTDKEFCGEYRRELFESENIHSHGWVRIGGQQFFDLQAGCGWLINPTSGEGSSGSVCNAAKLGLIPMVTREAFADVARHGFELADFRVETIRNLVLQASALPVEEMRSKSEKTVEFADRHYSEAAFCMRWRAIASELFRMSREKRP